MKTLLVYYSFGGNNELLANTLQERLNCDVYRIKTLKKRNTFSIFMDIFFKRSPLIEPITISVQDYDLVILSSPIWMGEIASPLRSFLKSESEHLQAYAFISICGIKGNPKLYYQLESFTGKEPEQVIELDIQSILPEDNKYTTDYKISPVELTRFEPEISAFVEALDNALFMA